MYRIQWLCSGGVHDGWWRTVRASDDLAWAVREARMMIAAGEIEWFRVWVVDDSGQVVEMWEVEIDEPCCVICDDRR
jgi:hypothetical protein